MRKRNTEWAKIINVAAFSILLLLVIYKLSPQTPLQIPNDGFERVNVTIEGTALTFVSGCRNITMNVVDTQALSIINGMANRIDTRPLTHDMMNDIIENFGITVVLVKIDALENEIYHAKTILQKDNSILELDTRPSDAVGIAVRTEAPVYFNETLMETRGTNIC